ncbi:MAG: FtsX-like permease family protein [Longicatena caecimuris]|uniref:FtsX-like permease family protein n=1 Tax=Longicatena caecimuris TaxID=1796635 RepID=UPI003992F6EC
MGSILPVLFLLIAVLTMVTTMHRVAAKEKTQIGTLKALGFKDKKDFAPLHLLRLYNWNYRNGFGNCVRLFCCLACP